MGLKIEQAGLSAGTFGRSRSDGLDTGALVTVTLQTAGTVELLWVPDDDTTAVASLTQTGPAVWTFNPTAAIWGTYRVRGNEAGGSTIRTFSIRSPALGLRLPAAGERSSANANLVTGAGYIDARETNEEYAENTSFSSGRWEGSYNALRDLFRAAETLSVGGGGVPTSRNMIAGAGLTGGGTLAADRTFNVVAHADASIVVNADSIQVGVLASDAQHGVRGGGTQHAAVTTSVNGFMLAADMLKLDGIADGATVGVTSARQVIAGAGLTGGGDLSADRTLNVVAHADASIVVAADSVQVGVLASDAQHGVRGGGTQHAVATTSVAGFMSGADKTKLDGITVSLQAAYDGGNTMDVLTTTASGVRIRASDNLADVLLHLLRDTTGQQTLFKAPDALTIARNGTNMLITSGAGVLATGSDNASSSGAIFLAVNTPGAAVTGEAGHGGAITIQGVKGGNASGSAGVAGGGTEINIISGDGGDATVNGAISNNGADWQARAGSGGAATNTAPGIGGTWRGRGGDGGASADDAIDGGSGGDYEIGAGIGGSGTGGEEGSANGLDGTIRIGEVNGTLRGRVIEVGHGAETVTVGQALSGGVSGNTISLLRGRTSVGHSESPTTGIGLDMPRGSSGTVPPAGAFGLPSFTSTERDALGSVRNGALIYNSTTDALQVRLAGAWATITAV